MSKLHSSGELEFRSTETICGHLTLHSQHQQKYIFNTFHRTFPKMLKIVIFFNHQKHLRLLIISFILMTLMCDEGGRRGGGGEERWRGGGEVAGGSDVLRRNQMLVNLRGQQIKYTSTRQSIFELYQRVLTHL